MHSHSLFYRQCFELGHGQQSGLAGQEVAARRPGHHPLTCSHRVPTSPSRSCFSCSTICFSSYSCSSCISSCRSCVGGDNPSHAQSPAAPCRSPTSWQGTATAAAGTRPAPGRGCVLKPPIAAAGAGDQEWAASPGATATPRQCNCSWPGGARGSSPGACRTFGDTMGSLSHHTCEACSEVPEGCPCSSGAVTQGIQPSEEGPAVIPPGFLRASHDHEPGRQHTSCSSCPSVRR